MDAKTFERNAQGDFYLYYRKSGSNQITYLTGTRDLHESSYIEKELPDNARRKNSDGSYHIVANDREVFSKQLSMIKTQKIDKLKRFFQQVKPIVQKI